MTPEDNEWLHDVKQWIANALRIPAEYLEPPPTPSQMAVLRERTALALADLPHLACETRMGLHDDTLKKEMTMMDITIPEIEMSLEHLDLATFDIDVYRETYEAMYEKEIGYPPPQEPFWYIPTKENTVVVKMCSEPPPGPGSVLAEGPPPPCTELVGIVFRRKL